jgi:hypothetical protein
MIFQSKGDINIGPLHFLAHLDALGHTDFLLKLLPLCLRGDGQATPKDHIDLIHLVYIVGIGSTMFTSGRLFHRRSWWQHLLAIQKSLALLQIMSIGTMDLTTLLYISRVVEQFSLVLLYGLLLSVLTISAVPAISTIGRVDFPIVLLLL